MSAAMTSILIPVFNNLRFLQHLLSTLAKHTQQENHEVILVDNGSTEEGMPAFYRSIESNSIKVIRSKTNLGFGRANNLALASAQGEYVALINTDMFVDRPWLSPLINRLERAGECAAAQAKVVLVGDGPPGTWRTQTCGAAFNEKGVPVYRLAGYSLNAPEVDQPFELQAFIGTGVVLKRSAIDRVGFFDEEYDLVFMEDTDLSLRLSSTGFRIWYEPLSVIYHFHSASMPHLSQEDYDRSRSSNLRRFVAKWPPRKVSEIMRKQGLADSVGARRG
jgi:GT2 family glycosyltransferase